jgi:sarcosine oxidase
MQGGDVEFVVVGAGVLGLSAARALARRGHDVVVCEQATVGHGAGGSKGSARIFRLGYDHPGYVRLAQVALRLWRQLEEDSQRTLVTTTGQVTFGDDLDLLVDSMEDAGAPYERMAPRDIAARFPALSIPVPALFEPASGVIAADTCLAALRGAPGVEVRERTRVVRLDDDGRRVRVVVETSETHEELRATTAIVCAGPWTGRLVPGPGPALRPMPTLEQVAYLAPAGATAEGPVGAVPVFVERRRPWFYGLPVLSEGLVKVSLHGAGPAVSLDDLETHDVSDRPDVALVDELSASARRILPGLAPDPVATERCVYDNSLDGDFVLDRFGSVVVGAGTSGHGFKFAPLLGEVLADLATGAPHREDLGSPEDLAPFAWSGRRSAPRGRRPMRHP